MSSLLDDTKPSHVVDGSSSASASSTDPTSSHPLAGKNAPFTFSYDISGVPATFAVTHHANQVNVIVSQTGAVGTVIHAEADSSIAGVATEDTTFTVKVLLGSRDSSTDGAVALARRVIASMTSASAAATRPPKALQLLLGFPAPLSLETAKEVYKVLDDAGTWDSPLALMSKAKADAALITTCPAPPPDSVSALSFGRESDMLAAASWDGAVRVYNGAATGCGELLWTGADTDPLLDCTFGVTDDTLFAAGLSGSVLCFDPSQQQLSSTSSESATASVVGSHDGPVSSLCYDPFVTNTLLSAGWDGAVKQWDLRTASPLVATARLGAVAVAAGGGVTKALSMDATGHKLVVAGTNRVIEVFDLRRMGRFLQARESSLASQTRRVRCSPDGERFVVAGMEGRIAVEMIDPSPEAQAQKYAFKCAQQALPDGARFMSPIHALSFHPKTHAFAAGAQNGVVSVWDAVVKKRIAAFPAQSAGVSALAFSRSGDRLAVGISYNWEYGAPATALGHSSAAAGAQTDHDGDIELDTEAEAEEGCVAVPELAKGVVAGKPAVFIRKMTEAHVKLTAK